MDSGKLMHDICVLVTRPKRQAYSLCELIHKQGGKTMLLPTIEIIDPLDKGEMIANIHNISYFDIAIFVSANATHKVAVHWPKEPISLDIFAIGPGTAQALANYNIPLKKLPKKFSSEGLLSLPELQDVRSKKIIIFMGKGGKQLLPGILRQRGAEVTTTICYRRQCPQRQIFEPLPVNIITSTSSESLHNLLTMTDVKILPWLLKMPLLVISRDMLHAAKKFGFQKVIIAENASNEAVLNALHKWYSSFK